RIEIDPAHVMARRMADRQRLAVLVAGVEIAALQLVIIVETAQHLRDAAAEMRCQQLEVWEALEDAVEDEAGEGEAGIEGPADARGEAKLAHALLAIGAEGRMHHDRDVERG